ncbi:MAG: hypothetical protein P3X22_001970 [Thermoprotei archaeon]|nr:hypothetical protein [Thermoprotei archaeon]
MQGKPPVRAREILAAAWQASIIIILGWAGIIGISYFITIPARSNLTKAESALVTVGGLILMTAWLIAWRTLAKTLIIRNIKSSKE